MSEQIEQAVSTIINDSLRLTVPVSHLTEAAKSMIVDGVTEQAARVADSLRQAGVNAGLSESDVENALITAGLVDAPAPEPETHDEALSRRVENIERDLGRLLTVAKNYGLTH